eukprot:5032022-Amphidinium_carterae.1
MYSARAACQLEAEGRENPPQKAMKNILSGLVPCALTTTFGVRTGEYATDVKIGSAVRGKP